VRLANPESPRPKPGTAAAFAVLLHLLFFLTLFMGGTRLYPADAEDYDVLIKGGLVIDGGGGEAIRADVAVRGDRIVRVAPSIRGRAARVIDARGLHVVPGFIDLHSHITRERLNDGIIFREGRACLNYLLQGVTTIVTGQCGSSAWPMFEKPETMMALWAEEGIGPNVALLVGHASLREIVMGREDRAPSEGELARMKTLVREAMEQGAFGLSTGLVYVPGKFSETREIVELVKEIAPYGGIYHTHIRDEGDELLESVKEAIFIGETAGAATHISHLKASGKANWGKADAACALIEEARKRGLQVTADQYPYRFSSITPYRSLIPRSVWRGNDDAVTMDDFLKIFDRLDDDALKALYVKATPFVPLSPGHLDFLNGLSRTRLVALVAQTLIDPGHLDGPANARRRSLFLRRLEDPAEGRKIRADVRRHLDELSGAENIVIGACVDKALEGKSLAEAAALKNLSVEDTAIQLELMGARCVPYQMCDADIETIMAKDYVGTGSDGTTPFFGIGLTHLRSYATFLHKIKVYALEKGVVSLPHVIRSQTALPARIMHFDDRGWIREGYQADIAVIDMTNIRTPATLSNPHQYSRGVIHLLVNGETVVEDGKWTGRLPGRVLKLKKSR